MPGMRVARRRARRRTVVVAGAVGHMAGKKAAASNATQQPVEEMAVASDMSVADEIAKLAGLRDQGILTELEFQSKKKELLGL